MRVAVASIFRNSLPYVGRYFSQVRSLEAILRDRGDSLRLILAEGDSADRTWDELNCWAGVMDADVFKREHGGPVFGSVDLPERWRQVAWVCNGCMERVRHDDDALVYVESDLIWEPETMLALLGHLGDVPAVSPMCYRNGRFYDTWGYRKDGQYFFVNPPHHPGLAGVPAGELVEIDSAGSCIVMRGDVAKRVRFGAEDCVLGLGRSIREQDSLWLDRSVSVEHP